MFEEESKNGNVPPPNLPFQPDDMLADVEKNDNAQTIASPPNALSAGVLKKKEVFDSDAQVPKERISVEQPSSYSMKAPILGKVITFVLIVVLLGGVAFGAWWIYNKVKSASSLSRTNQNSSSTVDLNKNNTIVTPVTTSTNNSSSNDSVIVGQSVDTDNDKLDDRKEEELKTDPKNPDTDGDGLSDGDEVLIWHTDPLNPDSDGDGYKDGEEVKNGYNPLGPGKLFNVPTSTPVAPSI